jgi:hypothetical protein
MIGGFGDSFGDPNERAYRLVCMISTWRPSRLESESQRSPSISLCRPLALWK